MRAPLPLPTAFARYEGEDQRAEPGPLHALQHVFQHIEVSGGVAGTSRYRHLDKSDGLRVELETVERQKGRPAAVARRERMSSARGRSARTFPPGMPSGKPQARPRKVRVRSGWTSLRMAGWKPTRSNAARLRRAPVSLPVAESRYSKAKRGRRRAARRRRSDRPDSEGRDRPYPVSRRGCRAKSTACFKAGISMPRTA